MINAWSLLYEELNGTMDKTYPIENNELNNENINITTGIGNTAIYNVPNDVETDVETDDTICIAGGDFIDFTSIPALGKQGNHMQIIRIRRKHNR